ncbi:phage tail assembly chaperone [Phenylobacterium immobile]|uniref:phage tail assembly chaperone n=1 Tax=Phenylobacterium immobile TaxID=21 RepID=UPI000A9F24AA|nr:hypothetical protein [Phenylobacterium immobile]
MFRNSNIKRERDHHPLPDPPIQLGPILEWYGRLNRRRQSGMTVNPLTFQEIEAFERKALITLTAWQTRLIERIDDTFLAVVGEERAARSKPEAQSSQVPVENTKGMRSLFRGMAERLNPTRAKEAQ